MWSGFILLTCWSRIDNEMIGMCTACSCFSLYVKCKYETSSTLYEEDFVYRKEWKLAIGLKVLLISLQVAVLNIQSNIKLYIYIYIFYCNNSKGEFRDCFLFSCCCSSILFIFVGLQGQ